MEFLQAMGSVVPDMETTLQRFMGKQDFWKKFVLKFEQDPTYATLSRAWRSGSTEEVEREAHTLKGTSANLGFQRLSDACADMVMHARAGENEAFEADFAAITVQYEKVLEAIHAIE